MKASETVEGYLHQIRAGLHLDPGTEGRVVGELATYFEEKTAELEQGEGLDPTTATRVAIRSLGPAQDLARLMYAAHSRGSWLDVLLACQPHLLFAALCATHLWRRPVISVGLYLVTLFVSLTGWRRSQPTWIFPWIGYAFAPLLAGGLFLHQSVASAARRLLAGAGGGGSEPSLEVAALLAVLCAAGLWLFLITAGRTLRRDWVPVSLFTLPWPVLVLWFLHFDGGAALEAAGAVAGAAALADTAALPPLLLLTGTSALFLRLRRRAQKIWVLAGGALVAALVMILGVEGEGSFPLLLWISALVLALVFAPALMAALRRGAADLRDEPQTGRGSRPGG